MELEDAVVVVTGGGSCIGAALCRRFAEEGPRTIVVADLDGDASARIAEDVRTMATAGTTVVARTVDVADESQVGALVAATQMDHGTVDLFCANAGIGTGAGVEATDAQWEQIWHVNVMAHVYAARALLPAWLDRGHGYLLTTASAAGLLTNLGDAPYTATKHAAVGLAEWLSITYGDRGVRVSCLCPQGVRTPLLFGGTGGPGDGALATEVVKAQRVLEPEEVADVVVAGLRSEEFLILPHEEVAGYEQARAGDRERWLRSMRKLQARITGGG